MEQTVPENKFPKELSQATDEELLWLQNIGMSGLPIMLGDNIGVSVGVIAMDERVNRGDAEAFGQMAELSWRFERAADEMADSSEDAPENVIAFKREALSMAISLYDVRPGADTLENLSRCYEELLDIEAKNDTDVGKNLATTLHVFGKHLIESPAIAAAYLSAAGIPDMKHDVLARFEEYVEAVTLLAERMPSMSVELFVNAKGMYRAINKITKNAHLDDMNGEMYNYLLQVFVRKSRSSRFEVEEASNLALLALSDFGSEKHQKIESKRMLSYMVSDVVFPKNKPSPAQERLRRRAGHRLMGIVSLIGRDSFLE